MAKLKEELWKTLQELNKDEFRNFKWFLEQDDILEDFKGIPVAQLEKAEENTTVDLIVQKYPGHGALQVTMKILGKINRNDLVQHLKNSCSAPKGDDSMRTSQPYADTATDVSLQMTQLDLSSRTETTRAPASNKEPCLQKRLPNRHIRSPLRFCNDTINSGHVIAHGPGLSHGTVNKPATFTVVAKGGGAGSLSLGVKGPSQAEMSTKNNKDGTYSVSYLPTAPGEYEIIVEYDDEPIPGSPFVAKITGSPLRFCNDTINSGHVTAYGPGLSHGTVNKPATFTVVTKGGGAGSISLEVEGPSEAEINIENNKDGTYSLSYLPTAPGEYEIIVEYDDEPIPGSPFTAMITGNPLRFCNDTINSGHVTAYGPGLSHGTVNKPATFTVVLPKDGQAGRLSLSYEGPSQAEVSCENNRDGTFSVSYLPNTPGEYKINVKYDDKPIPGSPFVAKITGSPLQFCNDTINSGHVTAHGPGLTHGTVNKPATFTVVTKGRRAGLLSLSYEGPSEPDMRYKKNKDGTYSVSYLPTAPGEYKIIIKYDDEPIVGSPFTAKITAL